MQLTVWGINHKKVPLEIREIYSISKENAESGLSHLAEWEGIREAVIVSTCNRTEIYAVLSDKEKLDTLRKFFLMLSGAAEAPEEYFYTYTGEEAIRHLFEVAGGMDSMILGESQILNQLKDAYTRSLAIGATGTILNTLFHRAVRTGKRVRAETGIGSGAVSVSYAAVKMAEERLGNLTGRKAVVFGAGEAAKLAVTHFMSHGVSRLVVANRHVDKAKELAEPFHGEGVSLSEALDHALDADVFITSTGATQYILKSYPMISFMQKRGEKPLLIIDIAVPADVEPDVGNIRNITLLNLDVLSDTIEENKEKRRREAEKAKKIIEEEIRSIMDRFQYLSTRPVMVSLSEKAEFIRKRELGKAISKIDGLTEKDERVLRDMTKTIVRKILREPMIRLNEKAGTDQENLEKLAVTHLFRLKVEKGEDFEK